MSPTLPHIPDGYCPVPCWLATQRTEHGVVRSAVEIQRLDGFGAPGDKRAKYRRLQRPQQFHMGFKLFYTQDTPLMDPARVLKLHPQPEYISYQ
ncbi:MAG: hypothetical protein ACRDQA_26370 [Nocardioidaceae bacterium]